MPYKRNIAMPCICPIPAPRPTSPVASNAPTQGKVVCCGIIHMLAEHPKHHATPLQSMHCPQTGRSRCSRTSQTPRSLTFAQPQHLSPDMLRYLSLGPALHSHSAHELHLLIAQPKLSLSQLTLPELDALLLNRLSGHNKRYSRMCQAALRARAFGRRRRDEGFEVYAFGDEGLDAGGELGCAREKVAPDL